MDKSKTYKNGNSVFFEKKPINGMYNVKVYVGSKLYDKVSCDTRSAAESYYKAFCAIAKNN